MTSNHNDKISFVCPKCRTSLGYSCTSAVDSIQCPACQTLFKVIDNIPRFVPPENYARSFSFQWKTHVKTQLDSYTGQPISRDRFYLTTGWPANLAGETILEAGCGAGRFTEVIAQSGASIYSFDLSQAVEANKINNGQYSNVTIFQASIYEIPLPYKSFDRVFCLGVLQHTPDPKAAFMNLVKFLKPGGHIAVDIYDLKTHRLPHPKYLLRPIAKRLRPQYLYWLISTSAPWLLLIKRRLRKFNHTLSRIIPIYDYRGVLELNEQQLLEWAILDTFDGLSAWYEYPQTIQTIREWCLEANLENILVGPGPNGINARGVKPGRISYGSKI